MKFSRKKSKLMTSGLFVLTFVTYVLVINMLHMIRSKFINLQESVGLEKVRVQKDGISKPNIAASREPCIAAVLLVRIYRGDKPELTTFEVEQWIRYLQYAGVDELYLYDAYENIEEKLEDWVRKLFRPSEVYYHDWHNNTPYQIAKTQTSSYQHAIDHYKNQCEWHLAMDIDEYPFVVNDTEEGFLKRFIRQIKSEYPDCSEISFPNYIFSGYPKNDTWLIERIQRRYPKRTNELDKPLYIARNISKAGVHHNSIIRPGRSVDIDGRVARMNHYWGARLQGWGRDTNESLSKTIHDPSILPIVAILKSGSLLSNKIPAHVTNRFWNLTLNSQ